MDDSLHAMRSALLLLLLSAAGGAVWLFLSDAPAATAPGPAADPPRPQESSGTTPSLQVDGGQPPRPRPPARQDRQPPPVAPAPTPEPSALARELGLSEAELQMARTWHKHLVEKQEGLLSEMGDGGGRAIASEFNAEMERRRKTLRNQLGDDKANAVLAKMPVYQMNLGVGDWLRVDVFGNPLPFASEDARTRMQDFRPVR